MGRKVEYFCDFCGVKLEDNGYYHDATKLSIEMDTLSQSDRDQADRDKVYNIYLCDKDLVKLNNFIKESIK